MIQISNICSIWIADHSYEIKHKLPVWIMVLGILGILLALSGIGSKEAIQILIGLALIVAAVFGYRKHKPITPISKYALGIERASGRVKLFTAPDKEFVQKSARALLESIAGRNTSSEMIVMNFDNKTINVENAVGSNIIGGDVSESLVESL